MILSDVTLKRMLKSGELVVEPIEPGQIQPGSIDLRLGNHFLKIDENSSECISMNEQLKYIEIERNEIVIPPQSFLLATTMEYIKLPDNLTAFVEGRSSVGRMGLFIQNAGWVDAGFEGEITLELFNANRLPIRLIAGRRVCQMVFAQLDREAQKPYSGKYQGQRRATGSRVFLDDELNG
jgi:dCTP deaminase